MLSVRRCVIAHASRYRHRLTLTKSSNLLSTVPDSDKVEPFVKEDNSNYIIPDEQFTDVETCKNSEDFKWVDRIIPSLTIPEPPKHESYPTPSGWVPVSEKSAVLPYSVKRTRYHNLPVYTEIRDGGSRKITTITQVSGDIRAAEADLRQFLEARTTEKVFIAVEEVTCKLRVRGMFQEEVSQFLIEKGL